MRNSLLSLRHFKTYKLVSSHWVDFYTLSFRQLLHNNLPLRILAASPMVLWRGKHSKCL